MSFKNQIQTFEVSAMVCDLLGALPLVFCMTMLLQRWSTLAAFRIPMRYSRDWRESCSSERESVSMLLLQVMHIHPEGKVPVHDHRLQRPSWRTWL